MTLIQPTLRKDSVAYGATILMGSSLVLNLLGVCYRMVLARHIGPEGLALYQLCISIYSILSGISTLGITSAVTQGAATLTGTNRRQELSSLLIRGMLMFFFLYTILLSLTLPFSHRVADLVLGNSGYNMLVALLFPYMLLTGVENIHKSLFLGLGKTLIPGISEIVEQLLRILLLPQIIFLTKAYTAGSKAQCILITMFLGEIFAAGFMIFAYIANRKKFETTNTYQKPTSKGPSVSKILLSVSIPTTLTGLGIRLLSSGASILMPQSLVATGLSSQDATKIFGTFTGMTIPLLTMCTALTGPVFTAIMPKIGKAMAQGNLEVCRRKSGKVLHICSLVTLPYMAIILLLSQDLSFLMYGGTFAGSLAPVFIPCITLSIFANACIFLLSAMGKNLMSGGLAMGSGLLQLLNLIAWPKLFHNGLTGYAILETINDLIIATLGLGLICHVCKLKIQWKNWFLAPLISLVPGFGAAYAVHSAIGKLDVPLWLNTLLPAIVLIAIYLSMLILLWGLRPVQYVKTLLEFPGKEKPSLSLGQ